MTVVSSILSDIDAEYYSQHSDTQMGFALEAMDLLRLNGNELILDVGCGDGKVTAELAERVPEGAVKGVDISRTMVELAIRRYGDIENLSFQQCAAFQVKDEKRYDWVTSFSCLHWVRQPERAVKALHGALKPGGKAMILTFPKEGIYYNFLIDALDDPRWEAWRLQAADQTMRTTAQYQQACLEAGFLIEHCLIRDRLITYEDEEQLKKYVRGWQHCMIPLPEELREPFLDHAVTFLDRYQVQKGDGKIHLPYRMITMIVRA